MLFPHIVTIKELEELTDFVGGYKTPLEFVMKNTQMAVEKRSWYASQIALRRKASSKHPIFFKNSCVFSEKAIEQSTSEQVSKVKVDFIKIPSGSNVCDLTGGMGAETVAYAEEGYIVSYVEPNKGLFELSSFNFKKFKFGRNIQMHNDIAESFIENTRHKFELAILDPDRRAEGERDFTLENSSPNPLLIENDVLQKANLLWIKHSPMIDLAFLAKEFVYCKSIQVISFKNEVKEICSLHSKTKIDFPEITCLCVDFSGSYKKVDFKFSEMNTVIDVVTHCQDFLFEPDKAIIKSSCANTYAKQNEMKAISVGVPYYTSIDLKPELIGRTFRVIEELDFNERSFKRYLKQNKINKASVSARGFVLKADEIESKFGLKPSNTVFFFFYINNQKEMRVVRCEQIIQ